MTVQDILQAIDTLPVEDLDLIEQRIQDKRSIIVKQNDKPVLDDEWALAQIQEILKDVPPTPITYGTMDVNKLIRGIQEIREGLTEDELAEMIAIMNDKNWLHL